MGKSAMISGEDLSEKQRRFCEEFIIDLNATQAAIRSGYSAKTAEQQAARLLRHAKVQGLLNKLRDERSKRTGITADNVILELGKVGFSDIRNYLKFDKNGVTLFDSDDIDTAAVAEVSSETTEVQADEDSDKRIMNVKRKFKLHDKLRALDSLAKHFKLYAPQEVNVNVNSIAELIRNATAEG